MLRRRSIPVAAFALLLCLAASASAEVHVTIGFEPVDIPAQAERSEPPASALFAPPLDSGGGMVLGSTWFVPYFQADLSAFADATLWAVRNEDVVPVDVLVEYFPVDSDVAILVEPYTIPVHGVQSRNTRDVEGLPADLDGFTRGFLRFSTTGPVSVDFLQVLASQDFATSDAAATLDDVCLALSFRFLDFGGDRGSIATFLVDDALGADPGDDPTMIGNVYDEGGNFINSFALRTDQVSFLLDVRSFVVGNTKFGSIEIDATPADGAIGYISHSSQGRFSVSNPVHCRSIVPLML